VPFARRPCRVPQGAHLAALATDGLGHEQIHRNSHFRRPDATATQPAAHLGSAFEPCLAHDIADLRCITQRSWFHDQVGIGGVHGNRQIPLTGVKVAGLCTGQDQGRPMRPERFQGIEQGAPGDDVKF
jgi:hypothetical protein